MPKKFQRLRYTIDGPIARITLNRPEKRNALDRLTIQELEQAYERAGEDDGVKVVALGAEGPDFCAGLDLNTLTDEVARSPLGAQSDAYDFARLLSIPQSLPMPVVALVQGRALAGGFGLAASCDLIICDTNAVFACPEIKRGFVAAMISSLLIRTFPQKIVLDLMLTGREMKVAEAERFGLVARTYSDPDWHDHSDAFLKEMATHSAHALRLSKRAVYGQDGMNFDDALSHGVGISMVARENPDLQKGVSEFLDGRR